MDEHDPTKPAKPFHHGDLKNALLAEAERVLEAEGVPGLTLRGLARAVGVSPAAPSKHFDDLTGLLSELAASGHMRMHAALTQAMEAAPTPRDSALALGESYVAFAQRHPGLFTLMYRSERLDTQRPALKAALEAKRQILRGLLADWPGRSPQTQGALAAQATALWCLVHGYAVLLLDGGLDRTMAALPPTLHRDTFLRLVLQSVSLVG